MQFSDTTDKLGIIQACERYCNLSDAGISGDATLLKEFTAHVNKTMRELWHSIFMAYGGWQYDDSNQTDLPSATTGLTADQATYALPSGALTVRGIEVLNESSTWTRIQPITEEKIRQYQAEGEFHDTSAQPLYYRLVGDTIKLFPAPNYTQASSLKVFYDRGSVAFADTDTTKTPGFAGEYHDAVPIGASLEYLRYKRPESAQRVLLDTEYLKYKQMIIDFYTKRFQQMFPPRFTVRDQVRQYR